LPKIKLKKIEQKKAKMLQTEFTPDNLESIANTGLIISGSIGCGKTYVAQYLFEKFKTCTPFYNQTLKLRVFDIIGKWRIYSHAQENRDIIDSKTETVNNCINPLVLTLSFNNFEDRANVIKSVIGYEYTEQKEEFLFSNTNEKTYVYFIEEANCIFNTKEVNKGFFLDFVATARNYSMVGVYTMQRLSDSSTKIIERLSNFCFGMSQGDNDRRKIFHMIDKQHRQLFNSLKKREFLCKIDGEYFVLELPEPQSHSFETPPESVKGEIA